MEAFGACIMSSHNRRECSLIRNLPSSLTQIPRKAHNLAGGRVIDKPRRALLNLRRRSWSYLLAVSLPVFPLCAQFAFSTKVSPRTVREFDQYAQTVEQQLSMRWRGQRPFLSIGDLSSERENVLRGDLVIRPGSPDNPIPITDGLVHDWFGAVFIPNTTMQKVIGVLEDFDKHEQIYPEVIKSRLLRRSGNVVTGYWRLQRKQQLIPVAFDVEQEAYYRGVGPGKWTCRAYARKISEVDNPGTSREKVLPPGEGQGFLWRLYAYWTLETVNHGVLAECRTLSLSRSIPAGLGWAIKPFIQSMPRESLSSTLSNTRSAAAAK